MNHSCRIIYLVFAFVVLAAITSCRTTTQYIPIETVRTDSICFNKISVDTILQRDSVYIERHGDTLTVQTYKYLYKVKERVDTAYIERLDSIQVPYPVEKQLTSWQKTKMKVGGWSIGFSVIVIIAFVVMVIIRIRNKK
jgi:high-affinity nickel permease